MKSAYELAMERLDAKDAGSAPARKLTKEQKQQLADIDQRYKAKLAEREIFLKQQLAGAREAKNAEAYVAVEKQLRSERARLEEEREDEKNKVRKG